MKAITLLSLILTVSTFSPALAENFGQIDSEKLISLEEERVHNLVASSADIRKSIETGRSVAGQSEQDEKWASEFEGLMKDNQEKDYLGMALSL